MRIFFFKDTFKDTATKCKFLSAPAAREVRLAGLNRQRNLRRMFSAFTLKVPVQLVPALSLFALTIGIHAEYEG